MILDPVLDKESDVTRPLLVIDGNSSRAGSYHALPKTILSYRVGTMARAQSSASQIFCCGSSDAERPRAVIVGWDTLRHANVTQQFPGLSERPLKLTMPLIEQFEDAPRVCGGVRVCQRESPRLRGGRLSCLGGCRARNREGGVVLVASGDRNSFQLASDSTRILYPVKAGEMARIGPEEVRERYGVDPKQVPYCAFAATLPTSCQGLQGSRAKRRL